MKSISNLRKKANLTQAQLAQAVGVKQPCVAQWEKEKTVPRAMHLPAIARALNVTVDQLYADNKGA